MVKTQLYTSGREFRLPNGTNYIGAYHIHITKGAMEGGFHKTESHRSLTPYTRASKSLVERIKTELNASQAPTSNLRQPARPQRAQRRTTRSSSTGSSGYSGGY